MNRKSLVDRYRYIYVWREGILEILGKRRIEKNLLNAEIRKLFMIFYGVVLREVRVL